MDECKDLPVFKYEVKRPMNLTMDSCPRSPYADLSMGGYNSPQDRISNVVVTDESNHEDMEYLLRSQKSANLGYSTNIDK